VKVKRYKLSEKYWFQEGPGIRKWQFQDHGVKVLNVGNILPNGEIDLSRTDRHVSLDEANGKYSHFLVDDGDLVIASSGITFDNDGFLRTKIGFIEKRHLPLCMNTSTIRFKSKAGESDLNFLRHWLQSFEFRKQVSKFVTGSAQLNFGPSHLKKMEISLPTLEEQKRIAAILDQADALRKQRQRALDHLIQLGHSIFHEMFGETLNLKGENINRVTIDDVCSIKGGGTPSKANAEYYTGDIPWVSPKDMKFWEIETAKDKITQEAVKKSATNLIPIDSILVVNRSGILKHTVPIGITKNPVTINQDIKALIPNSKVTTVFLAHLLKFFEPKILTWVRATTADNFQLQQLKQLAFNLPSMSKQKKFGELYNETSRLLQVAETQLKETESLFASLQQRAFRGELEN